MKSFIKGICVGIISTSILSFGIYSFAENTLKNISVLENGITIKANGKILTAPNFVYNGRTYVQAKDLANSLGQKIIWNENNKTVYIGENTTDNGGIKIISDIFTKVNNSDYHTVMFSDKFLVALSIPKEKYGELEGCILSVGTNSKNYYNISDVKVLGYDSTLNKNYLPVATPDMMIDFFDVLKTNQNEGKAVGYIYFNSKIDGIIFDDGIHKCKLGFEQK